ncbi:MAG TPA: NUDIX domain-containing protein [Streptosporangiaceae bacterium]|nr:NUDIX domain-containing protein [Streptosporangiaceae bacterium]
MPDQIPTLSHTPLVSLLRQYRPADDTEAADLARVTELVNTVGDPWSRATSLHITGSALIVHPPTRRVLLRWHQRQQAWLQVGGHGDPGEEDPLSVALREAREETGLTDLVPWPDPALRHLAIVRVAAGKGEPEHEHADLRFVLATGEPEAIAAEHPDAPLRWLPVREAAEEVAQPNLRETLSRVQRLLAGASSD